MNSFLKAYRVMAGDKQDDLASYLNISKAMYSYCENGKRRFTREMEEMIYKRLKTKLKDKKPNLKLEDLFPID